MDEKDFAFHIRELILDYKKKTTCGIVFKLNDSESPLGLKSVLNVTKDKIKRWGNSNIFTYSGTLFENFKVIVIGAENLEEAKYLIIFVYLSDILSNRIVINPNVKIETLEQKAIIEIDNGIVAGFPFSKPVELELKSHLEKILKSDIGTQI